MSTTQDELIDALSSCFPASGMKELRTKASKLLHRRVAKWEVNEAVSQVRKHPEVYQWGIPHVKRGKDADGRFIQILTDGKGTVVVNESDRDKLEMGLHGTISHTATMNANEAKVLREVAAHTRGAYKEWIESLAEDQEAVAKKAARLAKIIQLRAG